MVGPHFRIMTFNVQLLLDSPYLWDAVAVLTNRARAVARGVAALPEAERPDVICFNEVFFGPGAHVLAERLKDIWPHQFWTLDEQSLLNPTLIATPFNVSNGVLIVSRLPFEKFPRPATLTSAGKSLYHADDQLVGARYHDAAGTDALSKKGWMMVRVRHDTVGIVNVAATHMQSFYDSEDQYEDVRRKQLAEINDAMAKVFDTLGTEVERTILLGDLNVRGDRGRVTSQYEDLYVGSVNQYPPRFQDRFYDTWGTWMHAPGADAKAAGVDQGLTNNDTAKGFSQRLDYMMMQRGASVVPQGRLIPHAMSIRFRGLSDHHSLEALISTTRDHCTPLTALPLAQAQGIGTGGAVVEFEADKLDYLRWLYADKPGGYLLLEAGDWPDGAQVFLQSNLSDPYTRSRPVDFESASQTSPSLMGAARSLAGQKVRATAYGIPEPAFFRGLQRSGAARKRWMLLALKGDSPATAIPLTPWTTEVSPWPVLKINATDERFYAGTTDRLTSGEKYRSVVLVDNPLGARLRVTAEDFGHKVLASVEGSGTTLSVEWMTPGKEDFLLIVSRAAEAADAQGHKKTGMTVRWQPELTFLRDAPDIRPLMLRCTDETGAGAFGSDEIRIRIYADGHQAFAGYWGDADTDEALPGADCPAFNDLITMPVTFATTLSVQLTEVEDLGSDQKGNTTIAALGPGASDPLPFSNAFAVGTGKYAFQGTLTRR